jgi:hypothetical protein
MITMNNLIQCCGMLFVVAGLIFPGNASATKPAHCVSVEDITDQENTELSYTFVDPPLTCYSFQVGANNPDTLKVTLKYANHGASIEGSGDTVDLDIFLYDSSGSNTAILNSDQASNQGTNESVQLKESDTPALTPNATYYVWINGVPDMDGYDFTLQWLDLDDSSNLPMITENSENPTDGKNDVQEGASGQSLEVTVSNSTSCTIYYGVVDEDNHSASMIDSDADSCQVTVPYGDHMTNNGTNYWYVIATNDAGDTRYPPSSGNLSFTVLPLNTTPKAMPWLMLLLKGDEGNTTQPTTGKAMPWLMLLL